MNNRDQSEFNMAVSYLNRLNTLFYLCDESSMTLDVNTWYHSLMALFRELSTEMKDEEINEIENKFMIINNQIQQHLRETKRKGTNDIKPELYQSLHKIEINIRKVLKESGLQHKMKEDWLSPDEDW